MDARRVERFVLMHKSYGLAAVVVASVLVASCSGNLGGGGGTGIGGLQGPVAPNQAPNAYAVATPLDREKTLEDHVAFASSAPAIVLPALGGFGIAIDLGAATPAPSASAALSGATSAAAKTTTSSRRTGKAPAVLATPLAPLPATSPSPLPAPSLASPVASPSGSGVSLRSARPPRLAVTFDGALVAAAPPSPAATDGATDGATPAAVGTGPASPLATGALPAPSVSSAASDLQSSAPGASGAPAKRPGKALGAHGVPAPSPSGPVADIKLTIYPDYAPKPPQPHIQSPVSRVALVRGLLKAPADVTLSSLGAVRFTVPSEELTPGRGFTVAIYDEHKKKKSALLVADTEAVAGKASVTGASSDPVLLHKGTPYAFILFADALAASPPPAGGYAAPGAPPGIPLPGGSPISLPGGSPIPLAPGQTQPPGYNQPYGTPTLNGSVPNAGATFPAH